MRPNLQKQSALKLAGRIIRNKKGRLSPFIMFSVVIIVANMPLRILRWILRFDRCHLSL
jgi:hypothetical protein